LSARPEAGRVLGFSSPPFPMIMDRGGKERANSVAVVMVVPVRGPRFEKWNAAIHGSMTHGSIPLRDAGLDVFLAQHYSPCITRRCAARCIPRSAWSRIRKVSPWKRREAAGTWPLRLTAAQTVKSEPGECLAGHQKKWPAL